MFLGDLSKSDAAWSVADIRARTRRFGRDPSDILFFVLVTVTVRETEAQAQAKYRDYQRYADIDGALALLSGWKGIDLSKYSLDDPFRNLKGDCPRSVRVARYGPWAAANASRRRIISRRN